MVEMLGVEKRHRFYHWAGFLGGILEESGNKGKETESRVLVSSAAFNSFLILVDLTLMFRVG